MALPPPPAGDRIHRRIIRIGLVVAGAILALAVVVLTFVVVAASQMTFPE